jgi:hypothetical protein
MSSKKVKSPTVKRLDTHRYLELSSRRRRLESPAFWRAFGPSLASKLPRFLTVGNCAWVRDFPHHLAPVIIIFQKLRHI